MHYMLIYDAVEDYIQRRGEFRAEHLKLANEAVARGELVLAGALGNKGSAFLFLIDNPKIAEDFAKKDPYVLNGLILSYKVLPWTTVVGKDAQSPIV
ncbi:MAG: YciI-like protein [Campylobacteraceae bacterium]